MIEILLTVLCAAITLAISDAIGIAAAGIFLWGIACGGVLITVMRELKK